MKANADGGPHLHEPPTAARRWRPTPRQLVQGVAGLALAAFLLAWGIPYFTGTTWPDVWRQLSHIGPGTASGLFLLMVGGLWFYTFTLTGSLPGLSHGRALILNVCGSSVGNLLPGGGAAGVAATYAMCRSWGFSRREISTSIIVSGVWNVLARVALPVLGIAALLAGTSDLPRPVVRGGIIGAVAAVALLALFISVIVSERAANTIGRGLDKALGPLMRRTKAARSKTSRDKAGRDAGTQDDAHRELSIDDLIQDLRARITDVVRTGWLSMTFGLVGFFGVYYGLFWFCLNTVGVRVTFSHMFAAYAVGRLLTTVGITPGGLGVTESGTAAVLVGWGADGAAAAAGVLLFSIYTHLLEIPLGAVGWMAWGVSGKARAPDHLGPPGTSASG